MQRARRSIAAGVALTIACGLGAIGADQAFAGAEVCTPCVMLIEVDGLEAKDVTPQTTPFLWSLAHSGAGGGNAPGQLSATPTTLGAAGTPGIGGRNGFQYAAARGTMTATTAASTISLLTGSYVDQSDVYADVFEFTKAGVQTQAELGSNEHDPESQGDTLGRIIGEGDGTTQFRAWIGDPRLSGILSSSDDGSVAYAPTNQDAVPAYCYIPENSEAAQAQGQNQSFVCPTTDLQVMNKAQGDLADDTKTGKVTLAYLYLAELGAVKRLHGDVDATVDPAQTAGTSQSQDAQAVAEQLTQTDAAIGALVNKYASDHADKWANTVLMVVGNHGYELTPSSHRVPDPDNPDNPGMGLADDVARIAQAHGGTATLIPSGSMATVYVRPTNHDAIVAALAAELKPGGRADSDPRCHPETTAPVPADTVATGCISELLATGAIDAQGHSTVPDQGEYKVLSVQDKHPSWRLHFVGKDGVASGSDGDLLVVMAPGWAAGTLIPIRSTDGGTPDVGGGDTGAIENPYFGSPGGPRNRSIAAIINGPTGIVNQVVGDPVGSGTAYPVAKASLAEDADANHCPDAIASADAATGNPNLTPGDDANAPGHECQAETVDFAPTMAALLRLSVPDSQLGGRFLQEAFGRQLQAVRGEEELPNIPPDDPPPPPEPDVQVPPPPPPPKDSFTYAGLLRRLTATVVDKNGCTWETARPGAAMDYLKIEGDFGKALSSTTLTFYQRTAASRATTAVRGKAARHPRGIAASLPPRKNKCLRVKAKKSAAHKAQATPPLKAIARFSPFALKRGHVKLNLKIPDLYRPTHIGVFVQEARRLAVPKVQPDGKPGLTFEAFGPATGAIVKIVDGDRLHDVKPASTGRRARAQGTAKKAGRRH